MDTIMKKLSLFLLPLITLTACSEKIDHIGQNKLEGTPLTTVTGYFFDVEVYKQKQQKRVKDGEACIALFFAEGDKARDVKIDEVEMLQKQGNLDLDAISIKPYGDSRRLKELFDLYGDKLNGAGRWEGEGMTCAQVKENVRELKWKKRIHESDCEISLAVDNSVINYGACQSRVAFSEFKNIDELKAVSPKTYEFITSGFKGSEQYQLNFTPFKS